MLKNFSVNNFFLDALPVLLEADDNPEAIVEAKTVIPDKSLTHYECPLSAACFLGDMAYDSSIKICKIAKLFNSKQYDPNILDSRKKTAVY